LIAVNLLGSPQLSFAADIRVLSTGAPAAVQQAIAPSFSKASGHRVMLHAETIPKIIGALKRGEKSDVVILPVPAMAAMEEAGLIRGGSRVVLARVGIGVTVREGAPKPDISTVEALREALLRAKSISHPDPKGGGFTGAHIDRMFESLDVAEAVRPKVVHAFAFAGGVESIAKGDVELGLFNISEIVPIKGVVLVGPLPSELQSYITFAGAIHADSTQPEPSAAYLRSLAAPDTAAIWRAGGFELLGGK
jgi:molybdate transport system substrate-binding protein